MTSRDLFLSKAFGTLNTVYEHDYPEAKADIDSLSSKYKDTALPHKEKVSSVPSKYL
jgi:hypothetical protein